jgi:cell wall-associated NlpC family hydrolase
MSTLPSIRHALPRRAAGLAVALLLATGLAVSPAATPAADAAVSAPTLVKVASTAAAQVGVPYRYGGTSPRTGFDCSGLVQYAYARAGKRVPRTAQQQYGATTRISAGSARAGDLVFFHSSRTVVYHVAVYAGHGYIWHAPRPGKRVAKVKIWTNSVTYGRVR